MTDINKGDMVVCLRTPNWTGGLNVLVPVADGVYTVRAVLFSPEGRAGFRFEELRNPPLEYADGDHGEPVFDAVNFRKIKPPDIGVLRDIVASVFQSNRARRLLCESAPSDQELTSSKR